MRERELLFRQAVFKDGAFHHWHYWGFCGYRDAFVSPICINPMGGSMQPTGYEVKVIQQYVGERCGPVSLGDRIYEGDLIIWDSQEKPVEVVWGDQKWHPYVNDTTRVVGDIYNRPNTP